MYESVYDEVHLAEHEAKHGTVFIEQNRELIVSISKSIQKVVDLLGELTF